MRRDLMGLRSQWESDSEFLMLSRKWKREDLKERNRYLGMKIYKDVDLVCAKFIFCLSLMESFNFLRHVHRWVNYKKQQRWMYDSKDEANIQIISMPSCEGINQLSYFYYVSSYQAKLFQTIKKQENHDENLKNRFTQMTKRCFKRCCVEQWKSILDKVID
ncbi:CLUMA_CG002957, isoform A [Clunio marinus]|uniref:CLUMA_CG002957, isoform A n=1 Tax=Clunio marinus TaxID=568069 RepID=A0A1J1HMC8_9DIPT|nr:CLUMA_CG002957, isoform A [Clunio marinus]